MHSFTHYTRNAAVQPTLLPPRGGPARPSIATHIGRAPHPPCSCGGVRRDAGRVSVPRSCKLRAMTQHIKSGARGRAGTWVPDWIPPRPATGMHAWLGRRPEPPGRSGGESASWPLSAAVCFPEALYEMKKWCCEQSAGYLKCRRCHAVAWPLRVHGSCTWPKPQESSMWHVEPRGTQHAHSPPPKLPQTLHEGV